MSEGYYETHGEEGMIYACPECDHGGECYRRHGPSVEGEEPYRCHNCSALFEEPVGRESYNTTEHKSERDIDHDDGIPTGLSPDMKAKVRELREASD